MFRLSTRHVILSLMAAGTLLTAANAAETASTADKNAKPKTVKVTILVDSYNAGYEGAKAMDGNPNTMWHTQFSGTSPALPHEIVVDLGNAYELAGITYLPRKDCANGTIDEYEIFVSDDKKQFGQPVVKGRFENCSDLNRVEFPEKTTGRYVKLCALSEVDGRLWTSIAELEILPVENVRFLGQNASILVELFGDQDQLDELDHEFASLVNDIKNLATFESRAPETFIADSLVLKSDRDPVDIVLRRTRTLLADIQSMDGAPDLDAAAAKLDALAAKNGVTADLEDFQARLDLFKQICEIRREIAFANPLLNFDEILFAKHHRATFNHMCDQYYGINSLPGGGIFVLEKPFSDAPTERDLIGNAVVQSGRLEGKKLDTGSFISPELSFDGQKIAFAYVELTGDKAHRHHTDPTRGHWHQEECYHVFTMNADGTDLRQLTDGTWNDFDPCFLPNGRILFVSERRGGYLRCGRVCPNYTLFDMADDGSTIDAISYHETNEWHPSVTNDGRILYTRWDYVDRFGCTAHHPWITTLDGRDSRSVHGNFAPRKSRPDMELCMRAIPGSNKFSGIAAPHHGQSYGSIILVDPSVVDDDAMAPVKRVTPDVGFPECQDGAQVYGSPWPLSEKYYLCVYDGSMRPGAGRQGRAHLRGNYGIYLVDAFGNRELIYRDPEIACLCPIPLRERTMPVAMTETTDRKFARRPYIAPPETEADIPEEGTLSVINVYDSLLDWPEDTKIEALRVIQILPMTTPSGPLRPHETGFREPSSMDSVVLCRKVLGTVPVEEDGSACFKVPSQRELLFQALDKDGLAIQSMRSATYLQEGDTVVCQGCHEPKQQVAQPMQKMPLAMRRAPSVLEPEIPEANPISYPLLIQPILDKNCVDCHEKHADDPDKNPPNLKREPMKNNWYASFNNLVPEYGFYDYGNGLRTYPGEFGAKASKLYPMLKEGHHDVKLSDEELRRIALWLDSVSMFYGVYEKEGGEAQLRGEFVQPTLE